MEFNDLFGSMKFENSAERADFENLFTCYFSDLPTNFYINQFDLESKYLGTSFENWSKFLQYSPFNSWKSKQISIIAGISTDQALAGEGLKDKESLNLLKARTGVLADESVETKPTIIVIPEDLFFKGKGE